MRQDDTRRPIAARNTGWARRLSMALAASSITPNQISLLSIVFAAMGAAMLAWVAIPPGLLLAAVCIQLRLVCNLLDGMVAVEGGRGTATGPLYNEFPDRVADTLLLVALGHACGRPWLGWLCAVLAVLTAYVRVSGGALGLAQDFRGPMAKPHRMAVLTAGCVIGALEIWLHGTRWTLLVAAVVIAAGAAATCLTRSAAIARAMRARGSA
ncbi:CDP-alcohol phosphatidyltransferase family protein [Pseudoxanthomonas sp. JBR18]|uniref:CDP-alcohol phosphatidyltransferase family protein n=1 Tax=Pseudoxanthomonas sp. JBR18 TaxID=2969308 RepID=UPI002305E0BF|nr:CDP-alcohol phosphatidyltransferase family protein [Pseudoxanthomonas sp. JBR18]WCE02780.1 CDP-alcohol phosphatidyltransferase family protein [Pseudoxanthomonas sp. JBR18]